MRAKRVKRMSAAPKKAARTQAKKTQRASAWLAGPGPILFGVACVACFVGAIALNLAGESPRTPDVAIAAAAPMRRRPFRRNRARGRSASKLRPRRRSTRRSPSRRRRRNRRQPRRRH